MSDITPTRRQLVVLAGGKPDAFPGRLQASPEDGSGSSSRPAFPPPPVLDEPEEDQAAPEELVATASST